MDFLTEEKLRETLDLMAILDEARLAPRFNIAPTQSVRIVHPLKDHAGVVSGERGLALARWGLVPQWAKAPGAATFNARIETVAEKPSFREAFAKRRCLIPASGYYEWRTHGGTKTPHYIHPAAGGELVFAGLYEWWRNPAEPEAPWLLSCTIVTTASRGPMQDLHDRQPVMLHPALHDMWLDPRAPARDLYGAVDAPTPDLAWHAVGPEVGNVRNDGPGLIEARN